MGTRGLVVVKYENKYYQRYNHMDSYPQELGKKLVNEMKVLAELDLTNEEYKEFILHVASDNLTKITIDEPANDIMIEWIYLVDVETKTLKVIGGYYIPTYEINDLIKNADWIEEFDEQNEVEYKKKM